MAAKDLPAAFEYISKETGRKINYVGHSQGTLIMFAALAEQKREVLNNIRSFVALAPVLFLSNTEVGLLRFLAKTNQTRLLLKLGYREFLPHGDFRNGAKSKICAFLPSFCGKLLGFVSDTELSVLNKGVLDILTGHFPAGTSTQDMDHFAQMITYPGYYLQKYDYKDPSINARKYGAPTPPVYDLSNIKMKIHLFAGRTDPLADLKDVKTAHRLLPSSVLKEYDLGHLTFLIGNTVPYWDDLIAVISE
jgi:pimeloyl-ACP methyl ester carboxylesterase